MKGLLRIYLIYLSSLWLVSQLFPGGLTINLDIKNFALSAGVLALLNLLLKPILKLLFFPINALSLGMFSFVINAGVFYLFLRLFPGVTIYTWTFPGLTFHGTTIPAYHLGFWELLILISAVLSFITNFFLYLVE